MASIVREKKGDAVRFGHISPAEHSTNLGFGDGAVRPLSSKVDPKILEALVTLGGGDVKKLGE